MYTYDEAEAVLPVLKSILACIESNDTYTTKCGIAFNLGRSSGICWHVSAYTDYSLKISVKFLVPVFLEMGLDRNYPIEAQIASDDIPAYLLYGFNTDLYSGEVGELRKKLLLDLIQYFENILQKELA